MINAVQEYLNGQTSQIEQVNREIKRRTRSISTFPDEQRSLTLICTRLRYVAETDWEKKRYLNMERLFELENGRIFG